MITEQKPILVIDDKEYFYEDILKEYRLILEKKSRLSASQRRTIINTMSTAPAAKRQVDGEFHASQQQELADLQSNK